MGVPIEMSIVAEERPGSISLRLGSHLFHLRSDHSPRGGWTVTHDDPELRGSSHSVGHVGMYGDEAAARAAAERHHKIVLDTGGCAGLIAVSRGERYASHALAMPTRLIPFDAPLPFLAFTECGMRVNDSDGYRRIGRGVRRAIDVVTCGRCNPRYGA